MPLSELLRLATGKPESGQQKSCPFNISSRAEDDLVELVWENGQIMMQSQSSRVTRSPALDSSPPNTNRACDADVGHAITTRIRKFGVQSVLDDVSPVLPSGELDLHPDGDTAPWLRSYRPIGDSLLQDYSSDILPEISGVTANGMCTQNSAVSVDKRSTRDQTVSNLHNGGNNSKASSSKAHLICSRPPLNCPTSDALGSGVSDIIGNNNVSSHRGFISRSTAQARDIVNDSANIKMDRQNAGTPTNYSNLLNFSHFSRPATLVKPKLPTSVGTPASVSSGVEKMEVKEKGSAACASNLAKAMDVDRSNSTPKDVDFRVSSARQPAVKAPKESCPPARAENSLREPSTANSTKGVPDGERTVEPMVASSSVGSGNSSDRVSCEQTHNSKRKFHDIEELECRNDDIETESVDVKKPTSARGTGSKRSRAAEVHNLSERRRRDRINEKMRALQELIPNCSKVDKASMLDEAIEYLKTLQLQVQIMSMGAGFCMPPMMFPTGVQHMHPAHVPLFSPLGVGMRMGMGFGMGMLDMKGGPPGCPIFPVPSMQVGSFPYPMSGPNNFPRVPAPNLHVYGHPSQGLPNSIPRAPTVPLTGQPPVTSAMGLSDTSNVSHNEVPGTSPTLRSGDTMKQKNSSSMFNSEAGSSMNHKSNQLQATNEVLHQSAAVQANQCATDARGPTVLISPTATNMSKEAGSD